jgi:hypothetical protein
VLTKDDLIDIIVAGLPSGGPARSPAFAWSGGVGRTRGLSRPGPAGRCFFSESEIKKRLTGGSKRLTIPVNSIVSPLALEWLTLKGIEIVQG